MRQSGVLVLLAASVVLVGCEQATDPTRLDDGFQRPAFAHVPDPSGEIVRVCKIGPAGTYDFTVAGPNNVGGAFSLQPGLANCLTVTVDGGAVVQDVTVTEVNIAAGIQLDSIVYEQVIDLGNEVKVTGQDFVTVQVAGTPRRGATIVLLDSAL